MSCNRFPAVLTACLFLGSLVQVSSAQNWPQWRGPNRDGVVTGFAAPAKWPAHPNVKWKVAAGLGHASPVVAAGKVYLFTRVQDRETASCLDLESGKEVWLQNYAVEYNMHPAAVSHGKGPKSTPVLYNDKLYTLGISGILSCFDAKTGRLRWRKEFSRQFKTTSPYFGTAMSPIADRGLLIAHVGGHDSGALTAFDAESGEVKWSWAGDGPGYASPIIVEIDGVRQVVTQTQQNIVGVSEANGELLWQIPFATAYVQNIVTPVLFKETLILSGLDKGTMAIRLIRHGKKWTTEQVWRNEQVAMYMNSPVLSGHLLFGLSHKRKGQYFCIDARTGETVWTSNGRDGENAAIVAAGEIVLALTNDAELIVMNRTAKGFEPLKKYTMADSPTWAHPVLVGKRVLIKDATTLALWSLE